MDADDKVVLRRIADGVDHLVAAIPKPESRLRRGIELAATIAGAMGLIGVAQIILDWVRG
ncbi:hypothetical protein AGMMS50293_17250 [Spirochaetia bacterium]|nr:hypothetical protein AGMMS50293_17250 [Spirochaetia bacterium]